MGQQALILILGAMFTFGIINMQVNSQLQTGLQSSVDYYTETQLRNINHSCAQIVMTRVASAPSLRTTSAVTVSLFGGTASYTISDAVFNGEDLIRVLISSTFNGRTKSLSMYLRKRPPVVGVVPSSVRAAISTRANVATLGTLELDGRDHDKNGNLLTPASGTLGIWTTGTISQGGSTDIGGFAGGTGYAPTKPANSNAIKTGQPADSAAPSPDRAMGGAAMGYPEGTLKAIAMSGAGGSQYTTNPATLNYPLKGVTFVELPAGTIWTSTNLEGDGVLVVSNSTRDAQMKNLNTGTFRGLLIADDIIHLHTDIIGAVILLTATPLDGNCIGNGSGRVLYSSSAVRDGTAQAMEAGNIGGSSQVNFGFRNTRLFVRYWYE